MTEVAHETNSRVAMFGNSTWHAKNTLHWSASHAHCLIYMIKALFNTSTGTLMSHSPENTWALHAEVWALIGSPFSLMPVCPSPSPWQVPSIWANNARPLSLPSHRNNGSQLPVNNKLEYSKPRRAEEWERLRKPEVCDPMRSLQMSVCGAGRPPVFDM